MTDRDFMRRAIALAARGEESVNPNPMVGAVIVKDGKIIGEGWHKKYGGLHAEREAIASLREPAAGATIYVTLEPCCHYGKQPPCTLAIIEHGISRVVIGSRDPNPKVAGGGVKILREHGITVEEDFMREECDALNPFFFHYITTGTPYVRMKYAMTADGKIATKTGASKWISGEASRALVHRWRGACMGIMAGIGTVLADDPMLNCRAEGGRDPVRIICDTNLRIPGSSQICRTAEKCATILVCGFPWLREGKLQKTDLPESGLCLEQAERSSRILLFLEHGITVYNLPDPAGKGVDLKKLMKALGSEEIDSVLLEGGGTLNESALRAGIVQEVDVFVAPKIFGGKARSPVEGEGVSLPDEAAGLIMLSAERIGEDLLIRYGLKESGNVYGDH